LINLINLFNYHNYLLTIDYDLYIDLFNVLLLQWLNRYYSFT